MRADRSRRLAALENRPAPAPLSPADLACHAAMEALYESHASRVEPRVVEALQSLPADASLRDVAVVWCDFLEAVGRVDPEAEAEFNRLMDRYVDEEPPAAKPRRRS
ncbi:hypothetical protein NG829_03555 [Xanthomonas sacchari]|uniref:hypothetical protein n=1 Tax=Xanthomonas sacchari TaxID=56458 RepID=UPI00225E5DEB|nr:hypothetical protein [Xanthomonas sacchari]UYK81404.1 hypothetical protein NG829_03555 [Xanthomonas sacchari]